MNGFERKTRPEIVEDMKSKARNLFGGDINLNTNSPLGIIIQLVSYPVSLLWFALESVYNAMDINAAVEQDLDNLAKRIGIQRFSSAKSVGEVTFTGDDGVFIPAGFEVETAEEEPKIFETLEEATITGGSVTVEIISVEGGSIYNVPSNTITEMAEILAGVDSLTNQEATQGGRDRETDTELRERYFNSLDRPGGSTTSSIRANILEETETTDCLVLENVAMSTDGNGLPAKSFEAIVFGGTNQAIAEAIYNKKPAGIEPYGQLSEIITDNLNNDHEIKFSRATSVDIYIEIIVETNINFPEDGHNLIKEEIIKYINNLSINDDVIYRKVIDVAFNIKGVTDVNILLVDTVDPPVGETNVNIGFREVAYPAEVVVA